MHIMLDRGRGKAGKVELTLEGLVLSAAGVMHSKQDICAALQCHVSAYLDCPGLAAPLCLALAAFASTFAAVPYCALQQDSRGVLPEPSNPLVRIAAHASCCLGRVLMARSNCQA